MQTLSDPTDVLDEALAKSGSGFCELRFHRKRTRALSVENGRVDTAQEGEHTGVGVRVIIDGRMGFASTAELETSAVQRAIEAAQSAARASSASPGPRFEAPEPCELARGRFESDGVTELSERPLDESLQLLLQLEARTRSASTRIRSAAAGYSEVFEEKGIVTSDGAKAWTRLVRPEFRISAVAEKDGEMQRYPESTGATGGWECLFRHETAEAMSEKVAQRSVELLGAGYPEGGRKTVLLSPQIVGLLTHEAIGHTVEADFVRAGSVAAGKLGTQVASELVTLCDSGRSEHYPGAGGTLLVDDEGVPTQRTVVIENGRLVSYLHDRATAAEFGVAPTGNARAWEYDDEPLIRMRNTYIEPGTSSLEEMIANIEDGYLFDGAANGQADANGEFMFGTQEARRITKGELGPVLRGVNISGQAFEVLSSVSAVGSEFRWDLGSGYCGKGQPAKVDAGGPWLACSVLVGGRS